MNNREQIVEELRTKFCLQIVKVINILTILIVSANIIIFIVDIGMAKESAETYFSGNKSAFISTVILVNCVFMVYDIFLYKLMFSGIKVVDYKKNFYHVIILIILVFRIIFYGFIGSKLSICEDCVTGTVWQLGFNVVQFICVVIAIYVPMGFIFFNKEPNECFLCLNGRERRVEIEEIKV
ncbi:MAG: hypothetical protein Hyperionvirus2_13 [Hyperionvirus sp.]|uniref:Uncharacterized protein n=1 Tax=Hyperionvirus sp. TaxID=2487770 RepID=A0A3G5A5X0_9VIRU|nr:MAG: hypothetical protein Hyperionvirus2_13 [Hyperionvirus sp.]